MRIGSNTIYVTALLMCSLYTERLLVTKIVKMTFLLKSYKIIIIGILCRGRKEVKEVP